MGRFIYIVKTNFLCNYYQNKSFGGRYYVLVARNTYIQAANASDIIV